MKEEHTPKNSKAESLPSRRHFLKQAAGALAGGVLGGGLLAGCDSVLDAEVHSQLAPGNYLRTERGIVSTLQAAYAQVAFISGQWINNISDWHTDIAWETGGGINRTAVPIINYTWDSSSFAPHYSKRYTAIRDANIILENVEASEVSDAQKELYRAEARFVRATSYDKLYKLFGPVPLRTSTDQQDLELPRASEEEMRSFIEEEYLAVIPALPEPGQQPGYGRATNGAARGMLTKFYLNTKQWQKAADMAQEVIDMDAYGLYPSHFDMFKVQNEGNEEMIWVFTSLPDQPAVGLNYLNGAFPDGFQRWPRTGLTWQENWANWAAQYRLYDEFVNSFPEGDDRLRALMREYITMQGETVRLLGADNTRSFKFWPDPDAQGRHGNDLPVVRYADILLSRAEALNELNGPNPESVDLINQVRGRVGVEGISQSDVGSKQALRNHLIMERGWEFHTEGKRREDLIRMGMLIEGSIGDYKVGAQDRGIENAQEYHRRLPIIQSAMDANPALEQNPGY